MGELINKLSAYFGEIIHLRYLKKSMQYLFEFEHTRISLEIKVLKITSVFIIGIH